MKSRSAIAYLLFSLVLLTSCGAKSLSSVGATTMAKKTPLAAHTTYPPVHVGVIVDFATSNVCDAPLIAAVTVGSIGAGRWNTSNGARPALSPGMDANGEGLFANGYYIYTPVSFSRMQIASDHRTQPTAQYITMGGQDGQDSMRIDGYGQVKAGQRFLLVFTYAIDPSSRKPIQNMLVVLQDFPMNEQGQVQQFNPAYANHVGPDTPAEMMYVPLNQVVRQMLVCH
jgi:hypothetical protein